MHGVAVVLLLLRLHCLHHRRFWSVPAPSFASTPFRVVRMTFTLSDLSAALHKSNLLSMHKTFAFTALLAGANCNLSKLRLTELLMILQVMSQQQMSRKRSVTVIAGTISCLFSFIIISSNFIICSIVMIWSLLVSHKCWCWAVGWEGLRSSASSCSSLQCRYSAPSSHSSTKSLQSRQV